MPHLPANVLSPPLPGLGPPRRGKVRDSYELEGELLLVVATDRISIFDIVLPVLILQKGEVLNAMNIFWRHLLAHLLRESCFFRHDLIAYGRRIDDYLPEPLHGNPDLWRRAVVVQKLEMLPVEAIVRGYLTGSGWKSYRENGTVCGHVLPPGLHDGSALPESIFTPTTKAEVGHDEHLPAEEVERQYGKPLAGLVIQVYEAASRFAEENGIILADTKFELGRDPGSSGNEFVFGDEMLTPDSSRFWPADKWEKAQMERQAPTSFDKEFVRDWGKTREINKLDPENPDHLRRVSEISVPEVIVETTSALYHKIFQVLTGFPLEDFQERFLEGDNILPFMA